MLMDVLVESGAFSAEASERIIEQAFSMEATPAMLSMSSSEDFVRDIFQRGEEIGLLGAAPAGAPFKPVCPSCGADLKPGQKFCTSCGHRLV